MKPGNADPAYMQEKSRQHDKPVMDVSVGKHLRSRRKRLTVDADKQSPRQCPGSSAVPGVMAGSVHPNTFLQHCGLPQSGSAYDPGTHR
jgi:hypothetical protein